jgi:threonine/homoserine/homoserine lactone efflux protein
MFFIKGLITGFLVSAPIGPVAVICIRRTLAYGLPVGFATGFGAALADTLFGAMACYGVTVVASVLTEQNQIFRLFGGLILVVLGVRALYRPALEKTAEKKRAHQILGAFISAFVLMLTNPMTVLAFAAVVAGMGGLSTSDFRSPLIMVAGIFSGCMLWWAGLSLSTRYFFKNRINERGMRNLNRATGALLVVCGAAALISVSLSRLNLL